MARSVRLSTLLLGKGIYIVYMLILIVVKVMVEVQLGDLAHKEHTVVMGI